MTDEEMDQELTKKEPFRESVKAKSKHIYEEPISGSGKKSGKEDEKVEDKTPEEMERPALIQKVKELQEEANKNYDLYMRSQAEIENMKKRNRREKEDWVKYANETLIREMLPVMDNLEMALAHSHHENARDSLMEGVKLTLKGLRDALERSGLEQVGAVGEGFDPCFHEAVFQEEDERMEPGKVLREIQKGYLLNKRLIRPAKVIVCKGKPGHGADEQNTPEKRC